MVKVDTQLNQILTSTLAVKLYLHHVWDVSQVRVLYEIESHVPHVTHKYYNNGLDIIQVSLLDQGVLTILDVK